jgi:GNAT superfamily N-acetyltransferase
MATTFRLCEAADTDQLLGLLADWYALDGLTLDLTASRRQLQRILADSRTGHVWIVEQGGLAVGYTMLTFSEVGRSAEPRAYAAALYVESRCRGRGIGGRVRNFLRDVGSFLRVPVLFFDTDRESKHAALLARPAFPASRSQSQRPSEQAVA